jgi:hypothetical protein
VRTVQRGPRRQLYGSQAYLVDLQIDPPKRGADVVLTGQVMEMNAWEPRVAGLQVRLTADSETIAEIRTNALGEFRLEVRELRTGLSIVIDLAGTALTIPLTDLL